jgi:hypothetical protein
VREVFHQGGRANLPYSFIFKPHDLDKVLSILKYSGRVRRKNAE